MDSIISIKALSKTYKSGFEALKTVDLEINRGEILALLGPNGAGKTTLISTICGIISPSSGSVSVDGFDIIKDLSLIHISEPTRQAEISYDVFCLKKKKKKKTQQTH